MNESLNPALPLVPPQQVASRHIEDVNPVDDALLRLQRSRARLRSAMMPAPVRTDVPADAGPTSRLMSWLSSGPIGSTIAPLFIGARQTLRRWWSRHPWHTSTMLLTEAIQGEVTPLVRRYPVSSVAVAAALGAGLVVSGVLHDATVRRSAASAGRLARRWFVGQLSSPAMQTVLIGAITSLLASQLHRRREPTAAESPDAAAAQQPPDGA